MANGRDRVTQEVAEALRRAGADRLSASRKPAARPLGFDPRPRSPSQLMIVGVALLVAQWLRLYALLGLGSLGPTIATVGLVLLVVGFLSWLVRPASREMYWRGRRLVLDRDGSLTERLYRLLYRS